MNATLKTRITDQNLQSQHAAKCDLLIRISDTQLCYAVVDQIQDQLKLLYNESLDLTNPDTLANAFNDEPVLNFNFRKVKVSVETPGFTFIPAEVYNAEQLPAYSAFMETESEADTYVTDIKSANIKNILSVNTGIKSALTTQFSSAIIYSQAEPFIESAIKLYYKPLQQQLFLQFNHTTFEILLTEGKKVKFYNLFPNTTTDEFNYFLLFVLNQLNLSVPKIPVMLSGNITADDENYRCIKKYFKSILFIDSVNLMRMPEPFHSVEPHRFFSLLSLNVCA